MIFLYISELETCLHRFSDSNITLEAQCSLDSEEMLIGRQILSKTILELGSTLFHL